MKAHRWSTQKQAPRPFQVVDKDGAGCGLYPNMMDAMRALAFLNEHGNHAPYTLAKPVDWQAAS
jgi:hypothetical protein